MNVPLSWRQFCARVGISRSELYRRVGSGEVKPLGKGRARKFLLVTAEDVPSSLCTDGSLLKKNLHNALAVAGVQGDLLDAQRGQPCHLTPEQESTVTEKLKLLAPLIAFEEGRLPAVRLQDGREIRSRNDVAKWVESQNHGVAGSSRANLMRLFVESNGGKNIEVLARQPRKDRHRLRAFENRPELQKFATAKWVEIQSYAYIEAEVRREWGGSLLPYPKDSKPPGYGAIKRFIDSIPKAVRDCATLPKQKWAASNAPYITTGRGKHTRPNQVWVADHRLLDVLVSNDGFADKPGAAIRVWITVFQDMRTRVIVGWDWSIISPSWRSIARALYMGISRYGMPEICYFDNGRDFRKIGAGAEHGSLLATTAREESDKHRRARLSSETRGVLARLGIKVSYCTPFHPQAKQVESFFSYVSKRFDPMLSKRGYTGRKPELRSDFCAEAEKQHKEFLAGKRQSTPLMGAKEFMKLHERWIEEFNEEHPHSGVGMDGKTPFAVMNELLPVEQRQIPDMRAIEPLFWAVVRRKVRKSEIEVDNALYSAAPDDAESQANIYLANKTIIAVHLNPNDIAYALAFENVPSGRLLARLVSKELAASAPITSEHVQAMSRQRAALRKASMKSIAALTAGVPSGIELLQQRMTGTDNAPAASAANYASPVRRLPSSSAWISDGADEDRAAGIFDSIELED